MIVDEAAMVSTERFAALADLAERREWRLALVGDPLQFSAVGRSGMFGYLADTYGAIELEQAPRFRDPWEREASLRLRRGDLTVLEEYDERGRLHGGNRRRMQRGIVDAWWDAVSRGESANMMAPTTESVAILNQLAQQRRIDAGRIDPNGSSMLAEQYQIYVGDRVATRRNDRRLLTERGLMVKNRDHWSVEKVHRDGSLTVDGRTGRVRLPADYVIEHVELAYAETSHANQGRTVDRSFLFLDGDTDTRGIYVPMTRGRHSNEAFVVLDAEERAVDVVAEALTRDWIDVPALQRQAELERPLPKSENHGGILPKGLLQHLLHREHELGWEIGRMERSVSTAARRLQENQHDERRLVYSIHQAQWRHERAVERLEEFDRPMRRRKFRREIARLKEQVVAEPALVARERRELAELRSQQGKLEAEFNDARAALGARHEIEIERAGIRQRLDLDIRARARTLRDRPMSPVVDVLGPRPEGMSTALLWDEAAGRLLQHSAGFDVPADALVATKPRLIDYGIEPTSHRVAVEAVKRLDRALGRQLAIEPPQRELGLSL